MCLTNSLQRCMVYTFYLYKVYVISDTFKKLTMLQYKLLNVSELLKLIKYIFTFKMYFMLSTY